MKTYFAGSGLESFKIINPYSYTLGEFTTSTSAGVAVYIPWGGEIISAFTDPDSGSAAALTDFWVQAYINHANAAASLSAATQSAICFTSAAGDRLGLLIYNGIGLYSFPSGASGWTRIGGPAVGFSTSILQNWRVDVKVSGCGTAAGSVKVYMNGQHFTDFSNLDLTGFAAAVDVRCGRTGTSGSYDSTGAVHSVIASDYSTLGCSLARVWPKALGTYRDWAGSGIAALTSVAPGGNGYASTTAGQKLSASTAGISIDANTHVVTAVRVGVYGATTDGGPHGVAGLIRSGSSEVTGAVHALGLTFAGALWAVDKDPATGQPWTAAGLAAAEIGVASADATIAGS